MNGNVYKDAKEQYAELGVDTDKAIAALKTVPISLHCWQTDDVGGFESPDAELSGGGIQVTGNYPGKSRNITEMRADLDKVMNIVPGNQRLSLHMMYGEFDGKNVGREKIAPEHFAGWIDWAKERKMGLDFNGSFFSHPNADDGFTLSHPDKAIREFWIEHGRQSRKIAAAMGKALGTPSIVNTWIPDGAKDLPVDRLGYRVRLRDSLDAMMKEDFPKSHMKDAVETKLFGIGSESYVVGSHEFYMGYAMSRDKMICLDMGHFHPTESIADKLSSVYLFFEELLLHVSRPVRWDSDHVVLFNDDIADLTRELVRCGRIADTHIGLDFFDATMNRVGAYAIGSRAVLKGLLAAFLEPHDKLKTYDLEGNAFARLALLERAKTLPLGAVWDRYCEESGVVKDAGLIDDVLGYERDVQSKRK
ncbi:MAG: L-rhamnose isomerase [Spirochaetaceae bacterium]|nr:L-rhamnose isomerase [Spirochaetaceae bacterium]RKX85615.1 MAG: L-rhamnose isomerase [Spirochaetota bacterium]RKX96026.1 MAG: L-rhamnose isomerase [Spirochaetota bacterium]